MCYLWKIWDQIWSKFSNSVMIFLFIFFIFSNAIFFPEPWFFTLHTVRIPNIDQLWQQIWITRPFCLGYVKYLSMLSHLAGPTEFRNSLTTSLFSDGSFWSKYFSLQRLQFYFFFSWISCSVTINYPLVYDSSSVSMFTVSFTNLIRSSLIFNLALDPLSASL